MSERLQNQTPTSQLDYIEIPLTDLHHVTAAAQPVWAYCCSRFTTDGTTDEWTSTTARVISFGWFKPPSQPHLHPCAQVVIEGDTPCWIGIGGFNTTLFFDTPPADEGVYRPDDIPASLPWVTCSPDHEFTVIDFRVPRN